MIIRKASVSDIPALLELLSQVLEVHHKGRPDLFRTGAVKHTSVELKSLLSDGNRPVFVYSDGGVVKGYCFCIMKEEKGSNILTDIKTLYIDDLCVDERVRGQHIGSELYKYALDYAKKEGCYNVTLNVWALNDSALEFYKKMGLSIQKYGMETVL